MGGPLSRDEYTALLAETGIQSEFHWLQDPTGDAAGKGVRDGGSGAHGDAPQHERTPAPV